MHVVLVILLLFAVGCTGVVRFVVRVIAAARRTAELSRSAVEIAARYGSVSAPQLAARAETSITQAEAALRTACRKGLLFEAPNGAYYTFTQKAPEESPPRILNWFARLLR